MPAITRTIHVSMDYVKWVLGVDGMQNVLTELKGCERPLL